MSHARVDAVLQKASEMQAEHRDQFKKIVEEKAGESVSDPTYDQITQLSMDGFRKFAENDCKVEIPQRLTAEKEAQYRASLKRILAEEKISEAVHDKIIELQVDAVNSMLKRLNELSLENMSKIAEEGAAQSAAYEKSFEELGLSKDTLKHFGERLIAEDPISKELITLQTQKTMELQFKQLGELEQFRSFMNGTDGEDTDEDIEELHHGIRPDENQEVRSPRSGR